MVAEDLLFWIAPINEAPSIESSLLCRRHADAMVVPRGWTLDDRREDTLRLFSTRGISGQALPASRPQRRRSSPAAEQPEQMQIDGTGEIERPPIPADVNDGLDAESVAEPAAQNESPIGELPEPWQPAFDAEDDLDGLLEVKSPLLARAFRGTDRPKS
jgi:hypothetical protein